MLAVGENEEIYESRVYQIRPAIFQRLVVDEAEDDPDLAIAALLTLSNPDESTFRVMAKRHKEDGRLTFILVGVIGGNRALLEREDGVGEERFREFVESFEDDAFARGLTSEPTIVTADQWRSYDPRDPGPPTSH